MVNNKILKIHYRFDHSPRWLERSGLPQILGGSTWLLFKKLLEIDSRYGIEDMGRSFHISHEDLGKHIGRRRKFIREHSETLQNLGYIRYKAGSYKGDESLYQIVYPIKTPKKITEVLWEHGGLKDYSGRGLLKSFTLKYLEDFAGLSKDEIDRIGEAALNSIATVDTLEEAKEEHSSKKVSVLGRRL